MPHVVRSALVMHSAQAMFDLVNDVANYAAFVPRCAGSKVLSSEAHEMRASIDFKLGPMVQTFTTRNRFDDSGQAMTVAMELEDGPFTRLTGLWQFTPLSDEACKVELDLDFETAGVLGKMALDKLFLDEVANKLVDAFCKRANDVY